MDVLRATDSGVVIRLRVQPRASRQGWVGLHGDRLRVRLTAPPVEDAANKALIRMVASTLGVKRGDVTLVAGQRARDKDVLVAGLSTDEVAARLGL